MREVNVKVRLIICSAVLCLTMSLNLFASSTTERIYLMKILNQLNAIKPLVLSAAKEQPQENRVKFHYTSYYDAKGRQHNGLLEDINAIEQGINEKLNSVLSTQHVFQPIVGDYVDHNGSHLRW